MKSIPDPARSFMDAPSPEQIPLDQAIGQIFQGDCVEIMNRLPAKSVDLIFADPPYNLQLRQELYRPNMTKVEGVTDSWDRFNGFEEYDAFTYEWLSACRRLLKDTGAIWVIGSYHNIFRVGKILMDLGYWILNDVVWAKTNPMPNFRGVRFTNAHETLIWAQKSKGAKYTFNYQLMKKLNGGTQMRSIWELAICSGSERIRIDGEKAHATQKPEELLYRIVLACSEHDQIVFDPFVGSGTTGVVAKLLKRRWIGIERDPTYVKVATERIENVTPQIEGDDEFALSTPPKPQRIAFQKLIELGLIQPGARLRFRRLGDQAMILPDGSIEASGFRGSIHKVGSAITGAPCNGWEHWLYLNPDSGESIVLDALRDQARAALSPDVAS